MLLFFARRPSYVLFCIASCDVSSTLGFLDDDRGVRLRAAIADREGLSALTKPILLDIPVANIAFSLVCVSVIVTWRMRSGLDRVAVNQNGDWLCLDRGYEQLSVESLKSGFAEESFAFPFNSVLSFRFLLVCRRLRPSQPRRPFRIFACTPPIFEVA